MLHTLRSVAFAALLVSFAAPAGAAPAMFEASFIFHAWGNDISSAASSPYSSNDWTAAPLGYDCQRVRPYTYNVVPHPRYCTPAKMQRGHPATGRGDGPYASPATSRLSIGTGVPPAIIFQQSVLGIELYSDPLTGTDTDTPHCCRGLFPNYYYMQSFSYATFVNAAGSFFAGGGAAAELGYHNRTYGGNRGTWRIRAGANAFGGAMGLLGKYGGKGRWSTAGQPTFYEGTSSWAMVPDVGRKLFNTIIGETSMGKAYLYQNPFTETAMWYAFTKNGGTSTRTITAIGSGTVWTTGQVGDLALAGEYASSLWRTGYDNRTPMGYGRIQLVTPTLTHWLSVGGGPGDHTAQIGLLTLQVPEPCALLMLAAGAGALVGLRRVSRRH